MSTSPRSAAADGRASTPRAKSRLVRPLASRGSSRRDEAWNHYVAERWFKCVCGEMIRANEGAMEDHVFEKAIEKTRTIFKQRPDEG